VLLDLHPQPEHAAIEVWQGGHITRLGRVEQEEDIKEILEARARLSKIEGEGLYVTSRQRFFDLLSHFSSIDEWFEFQAREGYSGVVSDDLVASASRLLAAGGGEFVVREPIRASLLQRLPNSRKT
jgi:hypothetical protein